MSDSAHTSEQMHMPAPLEQWDENQLAHYLDMTPGTLRTMRSRGTGPRYLKLGRKVRYLPRHVFEWIEEQTRTSTHDEGIDAIDDSSGDDTE